MPRGRKKVSLEEQMENINCAISDTEERLEELKEIKYDLEEKIRLKRLNELDELINASGKTYEDVKLLLAN